MLITSRRVFVERSSRRHLRGVAVWVGLVIGCLCPISRSALAASLHEQIDQAIAARAGGEVAHAASDAEFVRRVSLDLAGNIPTPDVVTASPGLMGLPGCK